MSKSEIFLLSARELRWKQRELKPHTKDINAVPALKNMQNN